MAEMQLTQPIKWRGFSMSTADFVWWLLALTPLILLVTTWDVDGRLSQQELALRHYSFPVIAIEMFVIYISLRNGFKPVARLKQLRSFTRMLLLVWAIAATWAVLAYADDRILSMAITIRYAVHILFFAALIHLAKGNAPPRSWLTAMTCGGLLYVLGLALFAVTVPDPGQFPWTIRMPSATNIRQIGFFVTIMAVAPLALVLFEPKLRYPAVFTFALMIAFAAWSGSRGALAGLLAACIFSAILLWNRIDKRCGMIATTAFFAGLAVSVAIPVPAPEFGLLRITQTVSEDDFSTGRTKIWNQTVDEIKLAPLTGHGAGRFNRNMREKYGFDLNHPHQNLLQLLYDWGIVGGLAAFTILVLLFWNTTRFALSDPITSRAFAALTGVFTIGAISMIDGPLFYPLSVVLALSIAAPLFASHSTR